MRQVPRGFMLVGVLLGAASGTQAQTIWDSGAPHQVIFNGATTFLGLSSGSVSATQPQRWAAVPFIIGPGGATIQNVDVDYFAPAGSEPLNVRYAVFQRGGLDAPNVPDYLMVSTGILGLHDNALFMDDPRVDGADNFLRRFTGLNIPLAAGNYYFTIYGEGIGQGNTTGFSNAAWLTGADLVPTALERNGLWRSNSYPAPGFVEGANPAIQPVAGQDPNDVYNTSYVLYGAVVPAPGAAGLLGLGMLFGLRRRR